jgi:hypothetical protein
MIQTFRRESLIGMRKGQYTLPPRRLISAPFYSQQDITLARPPNFKQEKKRREELQKKKNEEKQRQIAARKANLPPAQKP